MSEETSPGAKRATEQGQRSRETAETIRNRTDTTAKALGAIGTAAVTAIGYAKLADVFPWNGPVWAVAALGCGAFLMIIAVVQLVRRFQGVSEPIVTSSSLKTTRRLSNLSLKKDLGILEVTKRRRIKQRQKEGKIIARAYERTAFLNQVESLAAYEARANRFERIAERTSDSKHADELHGRAQVIYAEVSATQARAVGLLVRERAKGAFFSFATAVWVIAFVIGWYAVAVSADSLEANRGNAAIERFKLCGEAQEKNPTGKLPTDCDSTVSTKPPAASVAESARTKSTTLLMSLNQCEEQAESVKEDPKATCASIESTLLAALGGG